MLRRIRVLLVALLAAATACGAAAQTDAATAELLMRQSGLWQQLADTGRLVRAGTRDAGAKGPTQPSAAEVERLGQAADAAFTADRMRAAARERIAAGIDAQHVAALRQWFDTELGRQITQLEEQATAASVGNSEADFKRGMAVLDAAPAQRRELIAELCRVNRAAEYMTRVAISTALAIQSGIASVAPDRAGTAEDARAALQAQQPRMLQLFNALAIAGSATTYAALPTPELARYVAFMKTPAAQHFNAVAIDAFEAAMVAASAEFGRRLPGTRDGANS